jgi:dipeptidyl-peptidase-3
MNGAITQLTRIQPGKEIEEAHMRNRALISRWVIDQSQAANVVELTQRDNKTYVVINDYEKLRALFGALLSEVQRIKSEGDYVAGKNLVESYGVKVDPKLHEEVLARYAALNLAPYKGFVNPVYQLVTDKNGKVTDVTISYDESYVDQQLRYSRQYSVLPLKN